jgi:hypothetical protein
MTSSQQSSRNELEGARPVVLHGVDEEVLFALYTFH